MSTVLYGVQFNPVPGWFYAEESDTPGEPAAFGLTTDFPLDKDGNYFVTGVEYRYYTKFGENGDPELLRFELDAFGNPQYIDDVPDALKPTLTKSPYLLLTNPLSGQVLTIQVGENGEVKLVNTDADLGGSGLDDTLHANDDPESRKGKGEIILQEGTTQQGGLPGLRFQRLVNGQYVDSFAITANPDGGHTIAEYGKVRMGFSGNTVQIVAPEFLISGTAKPGHVEIGSDQIPYPLAGVEFLTASVLNPVTGGWYQGRVLLKSLLDKFQDKITDLTDLVVRSLRYTKSATLTESTWTAVVRQQVGAYWQDVEISRAQAAQAYLFAMSDADFAAKARQALGQAGPDLEGDARKPTDFYCQDIAPVGKPQNYVEFDHVPSGTEMTHGLLTTSDNILFSGAYLWDAAQNSWFAYTGPINEMIRYVGNNKVKLVFDPSEGFADQKIMLDLKRKTP